MSSGYLQYGKEKRLKEFIIRFTYDSSKFAGVAVTLRLTSLILKEGIIPKGIKIKRDVKLAATPYVSPKWQELSKELDNFFKWHSSENKKLHPIEFAALVHLKIISLQPFVDGNSRLSRLLMNWVLWKKGYPAIDIPIEDLENYYNALDKYQIEKYEKPFVEYVKRMYLKEE